MKFSCRSSVVMAFAQYKRSPSWTPPREPHRSEHNAARRRVAAAVVQAVTATAPPAVWSDPLLQTPIAYRTGHELGEQQQCSAQTVTLDNTQLLDNFLSYWVPWQLSSELLRSLLKINRSRIWRSYPCLTCYEADQATTVLWKQEGEGGAP
eukprot:6213365-Pleurochrysis_carterae.AAC.6